MRWWGDTYFSRKTYKTINNYEKKIESLGNCNSQHVMLPTTQRNHIKNKLKLFVGFIQNEMFLTICQFTLPECLIESLTQCDVPLILCTLNKLLHFKLTWTLHLLSTSWLVIALVRCWCRILLISCLLWSSTMTPKQSTTDSMTLQWTQKNYMITPDHMSQDGINSAW